MITSTAAKSEKSREISAGRSQSLSRTCGSLREPKRIKDLPALPPIRQLHLTAESQRRRALDWQNLLPGCSNSHSQQVFAA
ncbi:hypothetical protein PFLUV_G00139560 [Perca fluviatilis]|uniref:Uncharacterized protein n=1 Tax=Perca fluviatilis TaxID=8168 RepID=A0A6A5F1J1_PERFL|nr:hypothetical protein PFLUV_G00139560 [Perca fluviatilis]